MKTLWDDRRTWIAFISIVILGTIMWFRGMNLSGEIVMIAGFICAANATENILTTKYENKEVKK